MEIGEALAVLDLKPGASREEIEAAYKAAVKAWHPDRFNHSPAMRDVAEAKLRRLNEAYEVLTNPSGDHQPQSADESESEYVDGQVVYLGHDPRLPPVAGNFSKGRPAFVSVESRGVALLIADDPNEPAAMPYPADSVLCLHHAGKTWLAEGAEQFVYDAADRKPDACVLLVRDPNGIERYLVVEVRFRNDYYAKLFVKRAVELLGLREPTPVTPTPTSTDSTTAGDQTTLLVMALLIFLLAAAMIIVAASTGTY